MKFKTKLYAGFGFILALIVILLVILLNMLQQLNQNMHQVVKERYEMVRLTNIIAYELSNYSREIRGLNANPPSELLPKMIENRKRALLNVNIALSELEKLETKDKSQELLQKLKMLTEHYNQYEAISNQLNNGIKKEFSQVWYDGIDLREQTLEVIHELRTKQEHDMEAALIQSRETYLLAVKVIYLYVAVSLLIGMGVSYGLIRSISRNLGKVISVMRSVAYGETQKLPRIEVEVKDEIGAIAEAFNAMASTLEKHAYHEKELMEAAQEHSWLKTQVAEVATMYAGVQDLQNLAHLFITKITPIVGAGYGVFYIMKEGKENQQTLYKLAAYANPREEIGKEIFRLGEGLIGQSALENRVIHLTKVPDNYINITSGTGMSSPAGIMILPAEYEGEVLAVIELASFEPFSPLQQMLLQEVMDNLGVTIHSIMNHMKVEKLLQESQALTEELQVQSEELQSQQEELRTINEELEEQNELTEQKSKELERIRLVLEEKAQQLEQSSQYKTEFLANMSHELRTPLNSLLILSQLLAQNSESNLTAKQVEFAQTIYSSGNDLLLLINDILDLSKVESGKMEVISEKVELRDVQAFVENQFAPIASEKGIAFTVQLAPELPEIIYTDKHRLLQILKNLLSNAFKFTKQGQVCLHIRKEQPVGSVPEALIAFSVSDTGIGIPKEKHSVIFEAFKQANGITSRQYGGTGLGLSISREIAYLLGGSIQVDSVVGKGSTFTFRLPNHDRTRNEKELGFFEQEAAAGLIIEREGTQPFESSTELIPQPYRETFLEGTKILIVDDDIRNIFALTTVLESFQMDVLFAENGKEGIQVLQENPDTGLVLIDIMMPEMDGFETMRAIRHIPEFQRMPIIAVTAKAMRQDREQCMQAGASDYISKPIDMDQLLSLMRVWLYK